MKHPTAQILVSLLPYAITLIIIWSLLSNRKYKEEVSFRVRLKLANGRFQMSNIRRGICIIGAAGSGKTESVIYALLQHFSKYQFSGIIHDYKDCELTEIAWPLFRNRKIPFFIISFDEIRYRVNPISPIYLPNEESVHEISKVLIENLLDHNPTQVSGSNKFFTDAMEGLLAGLIWKLRTHYPSFCTIPHVIAIFQYLDTKSLVSFLNSDLTSKSMAGAFIAGINSDKQTAGVKSSLANVFKKISSKRLFMVLSKNEVPLQINHPHHKAIIAISNSPQYDAFYAPIIASIIHTAIKQMSVRHRDPSFLLMEEASTIKLPNMHRIPATLRSYNISTVYVLQDKIQNDILYGEKTSKAILSNLSYQFFGKVNEPETAKHYEQFFEIIKQPTLSVSRSSGFSLESRITKGEKEVAKRRSNSFFRLQTGEFIAFADGKDKKLRFPLPKIHKELPAKKALYSDHDIQLNFERIHREIQSIFKEP
ncbi:type IV secretory system conjugative DNA transfer family protein [Imtechella halotolerans]|uniref:Mobilization protein C n=1 Tax=Imtechella halotolerans K1 TaxID=946077 RepID=I0WGH2_9FLAO|nr:TraM recognition domain-containing protein [Imtechella halotolerans]EID75488.1 mobilization protein C [Imtechella halotolerans K1]WMQ63682.1 TraM recognition domain-containing protein [Imtechella halotolerans]